ncbi:Papilin, partial [Araneus ventricosus]
MELGPLAPQLFHSFCRLGYKAAMAPGLKDLCFLPAETGLCRALFHNYYFNRRTGQCEKFIYGGCLGNENNFQKKEECEKACSKSEEPPVDESTEPPVDEFTEPPVDEFTEPPVYESTEPPVDEFLDPLAEEVLDPSFECGPDGFYPHPKNCRFFVKCSKGAPTLKTCPAKLHFNNKTKKCETPCKANCDRTYGTNALCFLPYKPGPCKGKFERFHFNKRSGECTTFEYGGCLGNENNFLTKHACERKCKHSLDICKLPYKTGPCKGKFERYYFNHKEGKCQKFTFGGCNGNHNNFKTLDECETTCLQNKYQETYPLLGCSQENSTWVNIDDCSSYYRCTGGEEQLVKCPSGQHYSVSLKRCTAPCDAYCEPSIAKSEDFTCVKDGLFRDPENCSSYIHCVNGQKYDMPCPTGYHFNERTKLCETPSKAQCQVQNGNYSSAPSFCKLPADKGPCKGSIPRWYYIPGQNRCWMFSWGGCRGNGNNFQLQRDCETTCKRRFPYSEDICRLPAETGPCQGSFPKYYFNHEEGKCKKFIYGGCKGNGNNFDSIEECERSCLKSAAYSEDICRLPAETGPCQGSF